MDRKEITERKELESAAVSYQYLKGLMWIPLGLLQFITALGNWQVGPYRQGWTMIASIAVLGLAGLGINRYYNQNYGRVMPSDRQRRKSVVAGVVAVPVMVGVMFLLSSEASWSLDLPVNPTAAGLGLFFLLYTAMAAGLKRHQAIIWGSVVAIGLAPVWPGGGMTGAANAGFLFVGVASIAVGLLDHRLLVRTFGPGRRLDLGEANV